MKVLIIEDEPNNARLLERELQIIDPEIHVAAVLEEVQQSITYLRENVDLDLIFMDIRLRDGNCFEIFDNVHLDTPIIFITAFDEYLVNAFKVNGVDYLLKPIDRERLATAISKFKRFKRHFSHKQLDSILLHLRSAKPKKIIIRKGQDFQTLSLSEVVYFFVDNKIVFCVDRLGKKYVTEWTYLNDAVAALDDSLFFKANRKYVINYNFIKSYKPIEFGKTLVGLDVNFPVEPIIISQDNSTAFKNWIRISSGN